MFENFSLRTETLAEVCGMDRQDILGPWKLIAMEAISLEGDAFYPFGETPLE
jgi:hypothetical protein